MQRRIEYASEVISRCHEHQQYYCTLTDCVIHYPVPQASKKLCIPGQLDLAFGSPRPASVIMLVGVALVSLIGLHMVVSLHGPLVSITRCLVLALQIRQHRYRQF